MGGVLGPEAKLPRGLEGRNPKEFQAASRDSFFLSLAVALWLRSGKTRNLNQIDRQMDHFDRDR
jgi:hypothetical protein